MSCENIYKKRANGNINGRIELPCSYGMIIKSESFWVELVLQKKVWAWLLHPHQDGGQRDLDIEVFQTVATLASKLD